MDLLQTDIFSLAERRMLWADTRQSLLAQNIANADTPGYLGHDVAPFAAMLSDAGRVTLVTTAPDDITGAPLAGPGGGADARVAVAPDGNAVALDDELTKVAETQDAQALTANLYQKYMGFFRTAFGSGG